MKVGIMQPYFLPYIGYWQLMNAVDCYVIFDDVNYITGGWINRNRILVDGKPHYITVPLVDASQNKKINEIQVDVNSKLLKKQLRTVELTYKKAPMFSEVYPMVEELLSHPEERLIDFILRSFSMVRELLGIHSKTILSSEMNKNNILKGQDKIIEICKILGATEYINAIGGKALYEHGAFEKNGIELSFLKTEEITYEQFGLPFQSNLSILDMMMFLPANEIVRWLDKYNLEYN